MAEDGSSILIIRKEIEERFRNNLKGETKKYFDEIENEMKKVRETRESASGPVKVEKDGLVMWLDSDDYGGRNLYFNSDIRKALEKSDCKDDVALMYAPINRFPLGSDMAYKGDLVDEGIEVFEIDLDNGLHFNDDDSYECPLYNEDFNKLGGKTFMAIFLTEKTFTEVSNNKEAMKGVKDFAFIHLIHNESKNHMILFLNCPDSPNVEALKKAVYELEDEDDYLIVLVEQSDTTRLTDDFNSVAPGDLDSDGNTDLCEDFGFFLTQGINYHVPGKQKNNAI